MVPVRCLGAAIGMVAAVSRARKRAVVAAVATIAGLVLAVPAASANFVASAEDAAGDAGDPSAGRDITAFVVEYDREGRLAASITLRGAPDEQARSLITIAAGMRTATGCDDYPAAIFGSYTDEFGAGWLRIDAPGAPPAARGEADKRGFDDAVQTFSIEAPQLADRGYDCAVAILSEPGNAANVYDTAGPVDLVGQPALSVRVGVPKRFKPGEAKRLIVRVTNSGDGPARGVRVRLSRERGLAAAPRQRSLGTLAAGQRRTVRVRLRLSARARTVTDLGIQVRERRLVARGTVPLYLRRPSRPPRDGGDRDGSSRSCVRYSPDLSGQTGGSLILVAC